MTTIFDKPLSGYRFVDTQFGDTLPRIAARELNDAARWGDLIAFNKLVPPYLTDDPNQVKPGVLLTGSQILVPAGAPVISTTTDPNLVFEIDALLQNGLLQIQDGDLAVVSGRDNFKQAIRHRLITDRGELIYHMEYGSLCRSVIGAGNGPTTGLLVAEYAKASLKADDRVSDVSKTVAAIVGDATNLDVEVVPVVGRPVQLAASL